MYSVEDILNGDLEEIDDDLNVIQEDNADEAEDTAQNEDDTSEGKNKTDKENVAKKVRKQSERPLLNAERLKGPRGLICMEHFFSDIKYRGSGHEEEDLNVIMTKLQHWCHRLYPKFTFDDTLEQLEKLGTKKPVITLKKKICMNMLSADISDTFPDQQDDIPLAISQDPVIRRVDDFDLLLDQEPLRVIEPPNHPPDDDYYSDLTEEQKEIIARNQLLAAERRKAKIEAQNNEKNLYSYENITSEMQSELVHDSESVANIKDNFNINDIEVEMQNEGITNTERENPGSQEKEADNEI